MFDTVNERALSIATITVRLLAERYAVDDATMNAAICRATEINLAAEQRNPAACAVALDALARLKAVAEAIEVGRRDKPVH